MLSEFALRFRDRPGDELQRSATFGVEKFKQQAPFSPTSCCPLHWSHGWVLFSTQMQLGVVGVEGALSGRASWKLAPTPTVQW